MTKSAYRIVFDGLPTKTGLRRGRFWDGWNHSAETIEEAENFFKNKGFCGHVMLLADFEKIIPDHSRRFLKRNLKTDGRLTRSNKL